MLVNSIFLALLLALPSAVLSVADDDSLLEHIDNFRREKIVPLKESFGFERFAKLVNETGKTMDFFAWLGHLFMNGTVGYCDQNDTARVGGWDGYDKCTIVLGANGSETLKHYILAVFEEMYSFHPQDALGNFEGVFSDKAKTDDFARRATNDSDVLGTIFTSSKDFYWRWATSLWGKHFVNSTRGEETTNGGYRSDVSDHCYRVMKTYNISDINLNAIVALTYLMGPDCNRARNATEEYFDREYEQYRNEYYNISNTSGFNGSNSNRCLQNFLVRYMDYDKKTYEMFVDYLARYLFQSASISFYGYCLPLRFKYAENQGSWIWWAFNNLEVLHAKLVDAMDIFDETVSDQLFMEKAESFRRDNIALINSSFGLERLRNVAGRTREVMEFFGWLGRLFANGVLGHFEFDKDKQKFC